MESKFLPEAYKPAEKLMFDYLILKESFGKLLREQKFPMNISSMLLKVYKNFQVNMNKLIALYQRVPDVLSLYLLTDNVIDEVSAIFIDAGLAEPLLDEPKSVEALVKFIIDLKVSYLTDAEKYQDAIPGFTWDTQSFLSAFDEIEKGSIKYAQSSNEQI